MIPKGENIIHAFEPAEYENTKGALLLTNHRILFIAEKGRITKSCKVVFSLGLNELKGIEKLTPDEINKRIKSEKGVKSIHVEFGQHIISSPSVESFTLFYNDILFPKVQEIASVYINRVLNNPANRMILKKAKAITEKLAKRSVNCCVCSRPEASVWIVDATYFPKEFPLEHLLIFVWSMCREHEQKWHREDIECLQVNYATLFTLPYLKQTWEATDMAKPNFMDIILERGGSTILGYPTISVEICFNKSAHLSFAGELRDFIKETE
jgi:hypothetical protein